MEDEIILNDFLKEYENKDYVDIFDVLEKERISVIEVEGLDEINGLYTQKKQKNIIFIDKKLELSVKRFTLAHEFCHFLLQEKAFSLNFGYSRTFFEIRADDFAMRLLLPKTAVLEAYNEYGNIPTLVKIFGVSQEIIERRINILLQNVY